MGELVVTLVGSPHGAKRAPYLLKTPTAVIPMQNCYGVRGRCLWETKRLLFRKVCDFFWNGIRLLGVLARWHVRAFLERRCALFRRGVNTQTSPLPGALSHPSKTGCRSACFSVVALFLHGKHTWVNAVTLPWSKEHYVCAF